MTATLFNRRYRLQVIDQASGEGFEIPARDGGRGLRITFEINKTRNPSPNNATIKITNLSRDRAALIGQPGKVVRLFAGYNERIGQIFEGDINDKQVKTGRQGNELITEIKAGERELALTRTRADISYGAGVQVQVVANQLADLLGLKLDLTITNPAKALRAGFAFGGLAREGLDELVDALGDVTWSIQNGILHLVERGAASLQVSGLQLSKDTGLIGTPTQDQRGTSFQALIQPGIQVQAPVRLVSERNVFVNGQYVITQAKYVGDSNARGPWRAECRASLLSSDVLDAIGGGALNLFERIGDAFTSPFEIGGTSA